MIESLLRRELEPVARRHRRMQSRRRLALCWAAAALGGFLLMLLQQAAGVGGILPKVLVAAGAALAGMIVWSRSQKWQPDYRQIARQIEEHHPELHALLLTAVEQKPDPATGKFNYLQSRVVREAIIEGRKHQWLDTISNGRLRLMQGAQLAALALLALLILQWRIPAPGAAKTGFLAAGKGVTVTPGDAEVERGSGLVVLARFSGRLPAEATLVIGATPENSRQIPLVKNLNDPVFGGGIPEVTSDFVYHIAYDGERTRDFKVKIFEHPRLERADARLTFPEYTGLSEKKIEDTRRISAVEGSSLDLSLQLNKPVASARLIAKDKSVVPLLTETNKAAVSLKDFPLAASQTYELQLVDNEGRTNKVPAQFVLNVLKNRPPELKIASPRGDQRVSPLEEMTFQAEAWDDFGLQSYGVAYNLAGKQTRFIELGKTFPANEKRPLNHLLKLEDLSVQTDQLISWFVWAEDIGPDGNVRRTSGDMYFAEVRPFEEIYREGQGQDRQSEQMGQQSGGESTKLAELQKQIINATWKLQRQETGKTPSAQYRKDAPVVQQSQESALEQAQMLKARAIDPRFQILWESVEEEMEKALKHLTEATNSPAPLPSALAAEQAAYQALLKLAAHEYQVSRSRSGGGGGGGQRNQQQLDQLELKQDKDRYETQRQASPQQSAEQREQLAVLNRLKELAQRQQDLNERIKELQTALQEARTEQEREEIRRRLKRLREEEQEMLADLDELRQRMEQPQNQSRTAEARQQMEQIRSDVQRAAQALENEAVSQALTSGTRAQRELQQLRDDFRKKNSSQFAEEMREMRQDARELAQKQEEIGKQMDSMTDNKQKTLSDSGEAKALSEQFEKQKTSLTNLLENMRGVSEKSEASEPLLAKQLYDTLRKTSQGNIENSLNLSQELLKRSFVPEAGQFEQRARQEIQELKQGVERAAESVLGDETEALRLAKRELEDLTQRLEREIARADSNQTTNQGGRPTERSGSTAPQQTNAAAVASASANAQTNQQIGGASGSQQTNSNLAVTGQNGQPGAQSSQRQGQSASANQGGNQQGQNAQEQNSQGQPGNQQNQSARNGPSQGGSQGQAGQPGSSEQASAQNNSQQDGNRGEGGSNTRGANRSEGRDGAAQRSLANFFDQGGPDGGGGGGGTEGPITGRDYLDWSERLGNVEEMLDIPDLRNEVARIRDRARAIRSDLQRHSKQPQWALVKMQIAEPLAQVRDRITEELARRESTDALVPIDRDPVPTKFSDLVRRYYEKLGATE